MSKVRKVILETTKQVNADASDIGSSIEASILVTTDRIKIVNGAITLPSRSYGDILWNKAMIFDTIDPLDEDVNVYDEYTCTIDTVDKFKVNFMSEDTPELTDRYAVVSYLSIQK
jgi:hypothetical protein